jgi:hypothetical protein
MCRRFLTLLLVGALALSQLAPGAHAQSQPTGDAPTGGQAQAQQQQPAPAATPPQTFPLLDKKSAKIKRAVSNIGIGERITLIIKNGDDLHGTVTQIGADACLIAEVDRHEVLTVLYRDIEKVRSGYEGVNIFTGKHVSQPRGAKIALFAGVMALIIVPLIIYAAGPPD